MANSKRKISFIQKYDLMVFIFFFFIFRDYALCMPPPKRPKLRLVWRNFVIVVRNLNLFKLLCFVCVCALFLHVITAIITASKYSFNARVKALCSNAYRRCLLPISFFFKGQVFFMFQCNIKKMQNSWFLLVVKTWKCRMIQSYLSCCVLTCSWLS